MARVELHNLSKTFPGGVRAIDDVSLDVGDGQFVVVVGPSGSGKSTLLRLLAGLEQPTGGAISFDGREVTHLTPRRRDVAMAFQTSALYPHLSVRENLAFPLRLRKTPAAEIDRRVRAVAESLSIADLLERRPATISGGERQRTALGRVLVRQAGCNLFDEPLVHLDPPLAEQLRARLIQLHVERPTTTFYVTHDQRESLALASHVAVLAAGKIRQFAPPLEIYRRPADRFVAGFFGWPPMQFCDGKIESQDGRMWFVGAGLRLRLADGQSAALAPHGGKAVQIGLRPDAVAVCDSLAGFTAAVRSSEVLSDRVYHRLELPGGGSLLAAAPADGPTPNGSTRFCVAVERAHFFAPGELGANLLSAY